MALYLDDQTRPWLERVVKNIKDTDFIGKRLQKMLEADRERLETMGKCEHSRAEYTGKKTCCGKCGSLYEVGMGVTWKIKKQAHHSHPKTNPCPYCDRILRGDEALMRHIKSSHKELCN